MENKLISEPDNSALAETDNAQPLDGDNPDTWDYFDPEEDQDNETATSDEGTEDEEQAETDTEEQPEVTDEAQEADEQADEEPDKEPSEELVTLADGTQVEKSELVNGYQRQADYTRKMQDVSNRRNEVAQQAERIERITQTFVDHLSSMVPPEPDAALAYSDPAKYQAQKAQYDASIAQVQRLVQMADEPKEVGQQLSQEDHQRKVQEETRKLQEALPETATREGQKAFWEATLETANELGFSQQELAGVTDHRVFLMAHWARKGIAADKAAKTAKAKVEKAPPATPRKPGQPARKANRNAEAMRKLSRSGSMRDALAIDFD